MSGHDDRDWLDALAGRERDGDTPAHREARALREALQARRAAEGAQGERADRAREDALVARARREGLLARAPARLQLAWPALAAAGIAALGVAFVWVLRPQTEPPTVRAPEPLHRMLATDPPALKREILDALREAGVEATGYRVLGREGIDAELPRPLTPEVRAALERFGIPEPQDGTLRIEIEEPDTL